MLIDAVYIIASQFLFVFFRTLNVKYTASDELIGAMVTGLMINILWITTTAFGIDAYKSDNYFLAAAYLSGGQVGVFYGMRKKQIEKFLKTIYNKVYDTGIKKRIG